MNIDRPILALFCYFGIGYLAYQFGTNIVAAYVVLAISIAYVLRGMTNLIEKSPVRKVNWGIFEVDKASLILLLILGGYGFIRDSSIEAVSNWILLTLGMIFTYKAISHYFPLKTH